MTRYLKFENPIFELCFQHSGLKQKKWFQKIIKELMKNTGISKEEYLEKYHHSNWMEQVQKP